MKKAMVVLTAVLAVAAGMRTARADDPANEMRVEDERMVQTSTASMGPTNAGMTDASPLMTTATPVILGEIASWNEHSVTLNTARGERMTFETDSRTMMPAMFRAGEPVKVEFQLMDDGVHHAGRIAQVSPGSQDWARLQQQMAMRDQNQTSGYLASNQGESAETEHQEQMNEHHHHAADQAGGGGEMSQNSTSDPNSTGPGSTDRDMNGNRTSEDQGSAMNHDDHDRDDRSSSRTGELPHTGSNRNWMLVLGLGAFAAAFGQRMLRRTV